MAQNGGGKGWHTDDETGEKTMPPKWHALLEWLVAGPEREPATQKEWGEQNGLHDSSVRRIKRDPRFIREWDRRSAEWNVHPERTQRVIDSLWSAAAGGDVKAAALYLQYTEKFTPKRHLILDSDRAVSGLSDVELAAEMEELVAQIRGSDGD